MKDEVKITLPKLGESIVSATIVQWFKQVGDRVERDEPLLEVSTDKVNSEIPSPVAGVLAQILALPDQEVQVGEALAILVTGQAAPTVVPISSAPSLSSSSSTSENQDFLSPSVIRLLKDKGIPLSQIDAIPRTGEGGRLTKKDVESYAASQSKAPCPLQKNVSSVGTERVKMNAMRKAIADNMVRSFYEAPHASLVTEVDVTSIVKTIQEQKDSFLQTHGAKLTITAFVARALARAVQAYPFINASLDGDTILMKRFVHLGIAVSVEQGIMVPVLKNCQQLKLPEIAQQIASLAQKARSQQLTPSETQEGSITLTNFGMTGTLIGIPIIRYPEVAIVGLGAITKKVVALADDSMAIRSVMMVSLTFDHRVLDGLYGCGFLNELKKHLEEDVSLD